MVDETLLHTDTPDQNSDTSNVVPPDDRSEASDEEEEECRVCRGPAEEGRPLYAPCQCSGSIGLTHQDCLMSWLAVTRGDGKCEVCHLKFQFAPKYKEGAPDHLSPFEVMLGLCNRAAEKWMPLTLRIAAALVMWLGVVPLTTTYLYQGWMHRPSSIISRFKWELVLGDLVSGAVIACFIIVTFLSFMSFADFLRFNWQNQGGLDGEGRIRRRDRREEDEEEEEDPIVDMSAVELGIIYRMEHILSNTEDFDLDVEVPLCRKDVERMEMRLAPESGEVMSTKQRDESLQRYNRARKLLKNVEEVLWMETESFVSSPGPEPPYGDNIQAAIDHFEDDEIGQMEQFIREQIAAAEVEGLINRPAVDNEDNGAANEADILRPARLNDRFDGVDPIDAFQAGMLPNDDADMDINVAVDELLGLRGPFNILIRNVFWLLAFNTTYLGLFAFIPKNFGSTVYSVALNRTTVVGWTETLSSVLPSGSAEHNFCELFSALNEESDRLNTTLRLPDLATITFGYLCMSLCVFLLEAGVILYSKALRQLPQNEDNTGANAEQPANDVARRRHDRNGAPFLDRIHDDDDAVLEALDGNLGAQLSVALECLKALVKVGVLLFLKMILLPLVLGSCLDAVTLPLFGRTSMDRILYAGGDLFASALLHWVIGITFMLLVTVSVLQLREVVHPGLLAHVIRPQEPQPDLLGNLLHEKLATHGKRMVLSSIIYAALLTLHVWLPSRLLVVSGLSHLVPFARPHFSYILTPQLQVPLELLVFHLTMLACLEKYKNRIGEMQHYWLHVMCDFMGLTQNVLPRTVDKFVLAGSRPIFSRKESADVNDEASRSIESRTGDAVENHTIGHASSPVNHIMSVDPFWYELARKRSGQDYLISRNIEAKDGPPSYETGEELPTGRRVLRRDCPGVIQLPPQDRNVDLDNLLPTSIGSYRLSTRISDEGSLVVDFWKEVPGDLIPRPPEGWDDLGVGGAAIQGRWAWGKERKSRIEHRTAQRVQFFGNGNTWMYSLSLIFRSLVVLVLSWFVITVAVCFGLSLPLFIGRAIFLLLRVPPRYLHDPFAFAIGVGVCISGLAVLARWPRNEDTVWSRFVNWAWSFRRPPVKKLLVVSQALFMWLIVSPLLLGLLYDLLLLRGPLFFSGEQSFEVSSLAMAWATGTLILNTWAFLCLHCVFTWPFWMVLGHAALDPDNLPVVQVDQIHLIVPSIRWQGPHGNIGRFISTLASVLLNWDWDRVDHEVLLQDCALPVVGYTLFALTAPLCAFGVLLFALSWMNQAQANFTVPFVGEIENGLYRLIMFRMLAVTVLLTQLAVANQETLKHWFQVAHKAARDGRYLEGEILMNYEADREEEE